MRYFLPPPEPARTRREIPRVAGLGSTKSTTDPTLEQPPPFDESGHLVRVRRIEPGTAEDYLRDWEAEDHGSAHIPSRPGMRAAERRRADTTLGVGPTGPILRRQRLAVAEGRGFALAAHWSVLEPVGDEDERAWQRLLDRVQGEVTAQRGWSA
jgi:hypothetical protein